MLTLVLVDIALIAVYPAALNPPIRVLQVLEVSPSDEPAAWATIAPWLML